MIEKLKWYWFVFFARRENNKRIKELKQEIADLSFTIGVEKNNSKEALEAYKKAKLMLYVKETLNKGLVYE